MKKIVTLLGAVVVLGVLALLYQRGTFGERDTPEQMAARAELFAEVQPVALKDCAMRRYGESNDGGYLLCSNLLGGVESAYSYGINGYDKWGCDVATELNVPVHRYDCFNTENPVCPTGRAEFHAECVGTQAETIDGRPFDSLANQILKNGDAVRRIVMKMDVEGAEWESMFTTSPEVLGRINQITFEFHIPRLESLRRERMAQFVATVRKLKEQFYVANLHMNNYSCSDGFEPFPAYAFEVLFVNKALVEVDQAAVAPVPHPLDEPNDANQPDCQTL